MSAACGTCAPPDSSGWPLGAESGRRPDGVARGLTNARRSPGQTHRLVAVPAEGATASGPIAVESPRQWGRLILDLAVIVGLFHWMASSLGSDRGQAGLVVGLVVVGITLLATRAWPGQTLGSAARALGLLTPRGVGLLAALGTCVTLGVFLAGFARVTGTAFRVDASSLPLLPGLFAQAGVAEEVVFRGTLFGRLRVGRTFWRAAGLSIAPFALAHLPLFATMTLPVALAAVLLSVALSLPFAHLFELGGGTIWPPAILHAVIQAVPKVLIVSGDTASMFPLVWMTASAVVSASVLLIDRPTSLTPLNRE